MRAAAVAIVFIFGAAVILAFANSLNSWVLGGLIGGMAALLISIPISVMLFTFLSRRHDLKLQAIHQELSEMDYVDPNENGYEEVYETDAYVLSNEDYDIPVVNRRMADMRALPPAGQSQATHTNREYYERTGRPTQSGRRPSQGYGRGVPTRDLSADHRQARRSMHDVNATRTRMQTAALRTARREAQQFDDVEVIPTHSQNINRRVSQGRTSQTRSGQADRSRKARPTTELPRLQQGVYQNGSRRTMDTSSGQLNSERRSLSSEELRSANKQPRTDALHLEKIQTDRNRVRSSYPETESLNVNPQSGEMARNPQLGELQRKADLKPGNFNTPVVRRPPYLYVDDPLRDEFAQHIDGEPIVRRSSRNLQFEDQD